MRTSLFYFVLWCSCTLASSGADVDLGESASCGSSISLECSGHGECLKNGVCQCVGFFTGSECHVTYGKFLGGYWTAYLVTFVLLYFLVALISLLQLLRSCIAASECWPTHWRVIHFCMLLEGVIHMIVMGLDPQGEERDIMPHWVRDILLGIGLYLVMATFIIILIYWTDLYSRCKTNTPRYGRLRKVSLCFRVLLFVLFVAEITLRVFWSTELQLHNVYIVHSLFLVLVCTTLGAGFLYFGTKMMRELKDFESAVFLLY